MPVLRYGMQLQPRREGREGCRHTTLPPLTRQRGEGLPEGHLRSRVREQPRPPDEAAHQEGRQVRRGDLGRGLRPDRTEVQVLQARRVCRARIGQGLERRELPDDEVRPRRHEVPARRPLRPALPRIHRRRPRRIVRLRCDDQLHRRHRRIEVRLRPRLQHPRAAPADRP